MPVTALPAYNPVEHIPPPAPPPTLRLVARYQPIWQVRPPLTPEVVYRAYLSTDLARALKLSDYDAIDLHPPGSSHSWWHLDLRKQARNRVRWHKSTRPRIEGLRLPANVLAGAESLVLCLVPGEPAYPGYYPLLPDAYFTTK